MLRRSNCLFFAVALWVRMKVRGRREPHFQVRQSRYGRFIPHFLVGSYRACGTFQLVSYKPIKPKHKRLPPVLFRGYIAFGDRPPKL